MSKFLAFDSIASMKAEPVAGLTQFDSAFVKSTPDNVDIYVFLDRDITGVGSDYYELPDDDTGNLYMWVLKTGYGDTVNMLMSGPIASCEPPYGWTKVEEIELNAVADISTINTETNAFAPDAVFYDPAHGYAVTQFGEYFATYDMSVAESAPSTMQVINGQGIDQVNNQLCCMNGVDLYEMDDNDPGEEMNILTYAITSTRDFKPRDGLRYCTYVSDGTLIYAIASEDTGTAYANIQIYTIGTDRWSRGQTLSVQYQGYMQPQGQPILNGNIMVFGTQNGNNNGIHHVDVSNGTYTFSAVSNVNGILYDTVNDTWYAAISTSNPLTLVEFTINPLAIVTTHTQETDVAVGTLASLIVNEQIYFFGANIVYRVSLADYFNATGDTYTKVNPGWINQA